MKARRTFIGAIAAGLLGSSWRAAALQPAKVHRIGILGNVDAPVWENFPQGLRDLGYVDGHNIAIERRLAQGRPELYPGFVVELIQLKVDLIVTTSLQAAMAAKQATSSIPIVMASGAYPDKLGLVESLSRPGGNVTGLSNVAPELMGKRLQLLKEISPRVSRVAVLWNPDGPVAPIALRELLAAAAAADVDIQSLAVRVQEDYAAAFATVIASRVDALHVFGSPINFRNRQLIADFALANRLPACYEERIFVEAGGLVSYAPSLAHMLRRAATYVDKILKGAKPADLPIEQPTKFDVVINLKTAKVLKLSIPRSLLLQADEIIQ